LHYTKREEAERKQLGIELPGQLLQDLCSAKYCLGNRNSVTVHANGKIFCTRYSTGFKLSPLVICNVCDFKEHTLNTMGVIGKRSHFRPNYIRVVSKRFGEWYQKTYKTEDKKKLTLLAFKIIAILHNTLLATFIELLETVGKGFFRNQSQNRCHAFLDCHHVL
jgi:hypothetical protein